MGFLLEQFYQCMFQDRGAFFKMCKQTKIKQQPICIKANKKWEAVNYFPRFHETTYYHLSDILFGDFQWYRSHVTLGQFDVTLVTHKTKMFN